MVYFEGRKTLKNIKMNMVLEILVKKFMNSNWIAVVSFDGKEIVPKKLTVSIWVLTMGRLKHLPKQVPEINEHFVKLYL